MVDIWDCIKEGKCTLQNGSRKRVGYKCVESNCKHLVKVSQSNEDKEK